MSGKTSASGSKPAEGSRRKSWAGVAVEGASEAALYGAAIGLTAYRLWSSRGSVLSAKEPANQSKPENKAGPSTPDQPPPAYEEIDGSPRLNSDSSSEEEDDPVSLRLKNLSEQLQNLIVQGQTALASPIPTLGSGPSLPPRHSRTTSLQTAPSTDRTLQSPLASPSRIAVLKRTSQPREE